MEMIYCKKWWFPRKKPIEILTEETSRNNHLNGEDYTVVLEQDDKVSYVVEMAKNDVFVHFMNDNEVNYITYAFHREHAKLFLNAAYYHNYAEEKEVDGEILYSKGARYPVTAADTPEGLPLDMKMYWDIT